MNARRKLFLNLALLSGMLIGCASQAPHTTPVTSPKPAPPPATQAWEDQIYFEDKETEKQFSWQLEPNEQMTLPMTFTTRGKLEVVNYHSSTTDLYFNEQAEGRHFRSKKHKREFTKKVTRGMLNRRYYLHVISNATTPAEAAIKMEFSPEPIQVVNKEPVVVTKPKAAETRRKRSKESATPRSRKKEKRPARLPKPEPAPPPKPADVASKKDPCATAQDLFDRAKTAYNQGNLEEASRLASTVSGDCPQIQREADVLVEAIAKQQLEQMQSTFQRIVTLVDTDRSTEARRLLPKLRNSSELYDQARELIESAENTGVVLGSLAVSSGVPRKGQGVDARGRLAQGRQTTYSLNIETRGDLEAMVDLGYTLRGGGLELKEIKQVRIGSEKVDKLRYVWLNVKPGTKLDVTVRNQDGNANYAINFYLYPN